MTAATYISDVFDAPASPVVFKGFGIMAVQLHRREISLKNARVTLEVMDVCDEDLRKHISSALGRAKTKKQLAKELEDIQDAIIASSSSSGSGSEDDDSYCLV